jgi:O-antigen ligase
MNFVRRLNFDWQIILIGLSAFFGWLIAYNSRGANVELALVIIGLLVYFLFANLPDPVEWHGRQRTWLNGILAGLPLVIAVYFLLTNDWAHAIEKVPLLAPLFNLFAQWPLSSIGLGVNPNVIGGALAALLPLQVFALRSTRRWIKIVLPAITVIALLLTATRGAWLALAVATAMWIAWQVITARVTNQKRARWLWIGVVVIAGILIGGVLIATPLGERLLGLGGDRRNIWQNSVDLIGDYPVTGIGLAGFEMVYSTYALLVHVGHTIHAHNLWLDMWLNQGILGVIALAGLILNAVWPKPSSPWRMPALIALAVILLHSLVDDPFYGYGGAGLPLIFIPLGLLVRRSAQAASQGVTQRKKIQPAVMLWGPAAIALVLMVVTPAGRALLEENLGAIDQTRAELSVYDWPAVPIQDALRRSDVAGSAEAVAHYQQALTLDPSNVAANRRLGQIELAHTDDEAACLHLTLAYAGDPYQRATRQFLGECKALTDRPDEAVALWRTIDLGEAQLDIRQYWYDEYLQDHARAAKLKLAAHALTGE